MTPDEVIAALKAKGVSTSRSTLLRYEHKGLIPAATRKSQGRGMGVLCEYPEGTVEAFVSAKNKGMAERIKQLEAEVERLRKKLRGGQA